MAQKQGKLIVISAPSGCGKTTIVEHLLERNKKLIRSVSYTTRAPREGERDGRDYFFVSEEKFSEKKRKGFFLESAKVFGCSYGTSRPCVMDYVSKGINVVLAIDVQGMKQLRKHSNGIPMISIFIMPPSIEALRQRLERRKTETKQQIEERLHIAKQEMAERSFYDHVVVNGRLDHAAHELERIVRRECGER